MNLLKTMGLVKTTFTGNTLQVKSEINLSASDLSRGVYFIKVSVKGNVAVKKIIKM